MKKSAFLFNVIILIFLVSCKQQEKTKIIDESVKVPVRHQPKQITYTRENTKQWLSKVGNDSIQLRIAYAVNRTDEANFKLMDSVVIPSDISGDIEFYLPFPLEVSYLKDIDKIIFFSYPTQTFAAYERGQLIHTGPTNMGRKNNQTPTGLFFTNWKAEQTTSTFDDEWDLRWNFNIANKLGVGWHQYSLPGYPASHSCLRLQKKDARYLYDWADQWELADEETVKVKGTPVIIFGNYDFSSPKPWLQLPSNPKVLDISESEIEKQTQPFLNSILKEQNNRKTFQESN